MKSISWEAVSATTTTAYGPVWRCQVKGGWLVGNTASSSITANKLLVFVPDPTYAWTTPQLTWQTVSVASTTTFGSTLRAQVPGGWLVGNYLSSRDTSSRTLSYLADATGDWLADAPPPPPPPPPPTQPSISTIPNFSLTQNVAWTYTPMISNPSNLALTFSLVGAVPTGLTINATTGAMSWTPGISGSFSGVEVSIASVAPTTLSNSFGFSVAAPAPPPAPAKWIGTNLMERRDWSTDFPFTNFFYQSRPWISGTITTWDDGRAINQDAQGNILSLLSGQMARAVLFTAARPVVDFDLTWTGTATVALQGGTTKSSAPNHLVITPAASGNTWLEITNVDATNPIKNISLKRVDQANVSGFFNPDFIASMKKYACIRMMDWGQTNYTRTAAQLQGDFAPMSALPIRFTGDGQGVPLSVMIELCNEANVDGWFCVNIAADATYQTTYLNQIKAGLATGLHAYVELSNELWNNFPQYNALNGSTYTDKMTDAANRAADLAGRTKSILGTQGIAVLGSQDSATYWQDNLLSIIKASGKQMPDALAIAPYFGLGLADSTTIYDDGSLLAAVNTEISNMKATKAIADKYGVSAICYEGGCSVMPGIVVNRDSRIGNMYATYLSGIKNILGGKLFCHYAYQSAYNSSGSWGENEYEYAPVSAKQSAIAAAM